MFLINGLEQETLPASDRATQFGDGCFTTARILDGGVCLLGAHILRLQKACEALLIPFSQWDILESEMRRLASDKASGVLKVIISRGSGGRGYSGSACLHPTRVLSVSDYPSHYAHWREEGVALALSPVRLGRNPMLAGIKHLNRLEQVLIRTHLEQTEAGRRWFLTAKGTLRNAVRLIYSGGRAVTCSRLRWSRPASTALCGSFVCTSWHAQAFALSKSTLRKRRCCLPMKS